MEQIPAAARRVLEIMENHGFAAYLVGGCVRDLLRGKRPQDWDMTTNARPEQVMALFEGAAIPTGLQHGTVTVREGESSFEVTTFRKDGDYGDHRHPDHVTFTDSLAEDLMRRDFTINAMALDLRGELTDLYGGREDLAAGVIQCVGDARRRFDEDALRILRGLRFAAALGFELEDETERGARAMAPLLNSVASERIQEELLKLLCGDHVVPVLLRYPDILGVFLPEILPSVGCDQRNCHHCYDVWEHIAHAVGFAAPEGELRMVMLLHDLGKPACMTVDEEGVGHFKGHAEESYRLGATILGRLRFSRDSTERILSLVKRHDAPIEPTERAIRRVLHKMTPEGAWDLLRVKRADNLAQAPAYLGRQQEIDGLERLLQSVLDRNSCFSLKQLAVNGNDLKERGYRGPEIGRALRWLLNAVIDGRLPNEKNALLEALEQAEIKAE